MNEKARKIRPEHLEAIVTAYNSGSNLKQIAEVYGCCPATIQYHLGLLNVKRRKPGPVPKPKPVPW